MQYFKSSNMTLQLLHQAFVLCPTRWTVRAASPQSVVDNYEVLLGVWGESKKSQIDSEMQARIIGIETQMLTFNFLFGNSLGTLILQHIDNLSKSLQHDTITAAEGQQLAKLTILMSSNPFVKKTSLKASTIGFCYTKVNLILMHQIFLAKDVLLSGSRLD